MGKVGSGKRNPIPALPATAAFLIFLMFLALFITVSPLIKPCFSSLVSQLSQNAITCFFPAIAKKAVRRDVKLPHLVYEDTAGRCSRTKRPAVFQTEHEGYRLGMSASGGQYDNCGDHVMLLVCNDLTSPGIAPGIPDKNAYHFQG